MKTASKFLTILFFAYINLQNKFLKKQIKKNKVFSKITNVNLKAIHNFETKITNPYFSTLGNKENLFDTYIDEWINLDVDILGGCCRIGPKEIEKIKNKIKLKRT